MEFKKGFCNLHVAFFIHFLGLATSVVFPNASSARHSNFSKSSGYIDTDESNALNSRQIMSHVSSEDATNILLQTFTDKDFLNAKEFNELLQCVLGAPECLMKDATLCSSEHWLAITPCKAFASCLNAEELVSIGLAASEPNLLHSINASVLHHLLPYVVAQALQPDCRACANGNCFNVTKPTTEDSPSNSSLEVWGFGMLFVTLISICSLVGVSVLPLMARKIYQQLLTSMIGLAAGSLAASAVFHLIPQAFQLREKYGNHDYLFISFSVIVGLWAFFIIERLIKISVSVHRRRFGVKTSMSAQSMVASGDEQYKQHSMGHCVSKQADDSTKSTLLVCNALALDAPCCQGPECRDTYSHDSCNGHDNPVGCRCHFSLIEDFEEAIRCPSCDHYIFYCSDCIMQFHKDRCTLKQEHKCSSSEEKWHRCECASRRKTEEESEISGDSFVPQIHENYTVETDADLPSGDKFVATEVIDTEPETVQTYGTRNDTAQQICISCKKLKPINFDNTTKQCAGGCAGIRSTCESCRQHDVNLVFASQQQAIKASFGHQQKPHPSTHTHQAVEYHPGESSVIRTVAWMIIFGDGFHNFLDGVSIGAAFSTNKMTGISISLAVMCEELPHELGDFAVLLNAGMTMRQALMYNFLSATTCYLGLVIGILLGEFTQNASYIFALAAGMFLYISCVDMVPELNEVLDTACEKGVVKDVLWIMLLQNTGFLLGVFSLFALAYYQDDISFQSDSL